ncbi:MAG: choice-of-anchor tandem repeat GloVer-containing protein [Bryobacteraceae bacterium]|jgi:uncharacterized repeat protein (TIGR03803 family)
MTRLIALLILAACFTAPAAILTTLHSFAGAPADGAGPYAGLTISPGGVLYGTTTSGGSGACTSGCGTVFSLTPPAVSGGPWTESFYSFPFPKAGNDLEAGVTVGGDGVVYGTTFYGGDCGASGGSLRAPCSD